jgi:hypothetical protein
MILNVENEKINKKWFETNTQIEFNLLRNFYVLFNNYLIKTRSY